MDSFYLESLELLVKRSKKKIIHKLDNIRFTDSSLITQADNICMVLDYSPKMTDDKKLYEPFFIKNLNLQSECVNNKLQSSKTLNLKTERRTSTIDLNDKENVNPNIDDNTGVKLSRISTRILEDQEGKDKLVLSREESASTFI